MSHLRFGYVLTLDPEPDGTFVAVLSDGSPQFNQSPVTVLSVERVGSEREAKAWFKRMKKERPWITKH